MTRRRRVQVSVGPRSLFWQKAEPAQRIAPFGSLLSLSFLLLFPTHSGFNNVQLNMMASEPFFYQWRLCCWVLAVDTEFYCIPTDRTAFGIHTWPRLVLHVGLRLVFFGGDGIWAKCHSNLAMTRLAWLVFCWRRPFVLFNEDAFLCDPAQKKKKKKRFLRSLFRPVGGGSSEPPEPPIATPLFWDFRKAFPSVWREGMWERMKYCGIDGKFLRLCQDLYRDVGARVRVGKVFSERYTIEGGLRQGCLLSPSLFSLFLIDLAEELERQGLGVRVRGTCIGACFLQMILFFCRNQTMKYRIQTDARVITGNTTEIKNRGRRPRFFISRLYFP